MVLLSKRKEGCNSCEKEENPSGNEFSRVLSRTLTYTTVEVRNNGGQRDDEEVDALASITPVLGIAW